MGLIHSRRDSGLIVAEYGTDGAAVRRALKDYDRNLELLPPGVDAIGGADRRHWRVYARVGGDRPLVFVTAWATESGEPLPLSMRLLDRVKEQDLNTRVRYLDADARNARKQEERDRRSKQEGVDLTEEHLRSAKKFHPVHRSVGLRMTRDKLRAKGRKI